MKVSYEWLQSYFDKKLPPADELAELLTFHSFEIESVGQVEGDTVIDVDVLPNRSSDCLSHRGIAKELSTILDVPLCEDPLKKSATSTPDSNLLEVDVQSPELVHRFSVAVISGIEVTESPTWLQKRLRAIGQKPINAIVDATNYVMFDIGQPLHAFDRDKLEEQNGGYTIAVRAGRSGERITTLTGDEYEVGTDDALIVDGGGDQPLGIAGIKGGTRAEIDAGTKNLVIEAANFNYASVRKTSQRLKLATDASVRFQNEPSPELTLHALRDVIKLIGGQLEGFVDYYPNPRQHASVTVSVSEINDVLGTSISEDEIERILERFGFDYTKTTNSFSVVPPFERTDLAIKEDLIEEVGRIYGYRHVEAVRLPEPKQPPKISKQFYYAEKIREILAGQGFSEVYTYALQPKGEVELSNALASDKPFLRSNLSDGIRQSLEHNARNADLLGLDRVCVFEIGTVFAKSGEYVSLALGVRNAKKSKQAEADVIESARNAIATALSVDLPGEAVDDVWEVHVAELLEQLPEPDSYDVSYNHDEGRHVKFQPISPYPFVVRDIALWTPAGTAANTVQKVVESSAGDLLVRIKLFDQFEKDNRISYAFRLVFLSHERTLTDEEVNKVMDIITSTLITKNWEVR